MITSTGAGREVSPRQRVGLETSTLVGLRRFFDLELEWKELLDKSSSTNPFLAWEWASTWVRRFCGDQLVTVVVRSGARTVGIAPFHRNRYVNLPGLGATALQLFGPREAQVFFEIREVLADPAFKPEVFQAVIAELERSEGWDWLELSAQGADVEDWAMIAQGSHSGLLLKVESQSAIPIMKLAASWSEQRQRLKRNIKESIRHSYNSLERDGHQFTLGSAEVQSIDALDQLFALHRLRSEVSDRYRHRDHFGRGRFRSFMRDALAASGALLFTLHVDGKLAAVRVAFDLRGQRYLYYSGFDPAWWRYGVMTLLVTEIVKDAIDRGLQEISFSPGIDPSKSRWGVELVPIHGFSVMRSGRRAAIRRSLLEGRKSARARVAGWRRKLVGRFTPPGAGATPRQV